MSFIADVIGFTMLDLLQDIVLPEVKEVTTQIISEVKDQIAVVKEEVTHENYIKREVSNSEFTSNDISDELDTELQRMCNNSQLAKSEFKEVAKKTNENINYAYWYMTTDDAKILKTSKENKAFINGVSEYAGYGKIYSKVKPDDITKYDAKKASTEYNEKYLLLLNDIDRIVKSESFLDKMNNKLNSFMEVKPEVISTNGPAINVEDGCRVGSDGLYYPLFGDEVRVQPEIKDPAMEDQDFQMFEEVINKLCPANRYHYYRIENGLIKLYIETDPIHHFPECFLLDNGDIMSGKEPYIMGKFIREDGTEDTMFVNMLTNPETARYILSSVNNYMTPEMVKEGYKGQFIIDRVYHNIDFSGTYFLSGMSRDEKLLFEHNLLAVIFTLDNDERLRLVGYTDPSHFMVVSDRYVSSPLTVTSKAINDGLTYIMDGKILSKIKGDKLYGKYQID